MNGDAQEVSSSTTQHDTEMDEGMWSIDKVPFFFNNAKQKVYIAVEMYLCVFCCLCGSGNKRLFVNVCFHQCKCMCVCLLVCDKSIPKLVLAIFLSNYQLTLSLHFDERPPYR